MENKLPELVEIRNLLESALNDANILLEKRYVKARAVRLRSKLDKIANLKIQLRKKMLEVERG